ncbi:hypothetical protein QBC47DRAFT_210111 [Echria macrotheca]|uniref:Uncharacterized protein n=1 Tax=Echria macrotheca TaxID=438768 RepID=A0AAJ0FBA8_9PEZI|nr:hypothetical protein QBC47DRAFT_210111 [Echria macrotheca]
MDNEPPAVAAPDDGRTSKRGRLMGKLFGRDRDRDRKVAHDDMSSREDLNDFLRGPSDTLQVAHAGPPMLAKLDTRSATRYPNALDADGPPGGPHDVPLRPRSNNSRIRVKKGLVVRFVDTYPEIMGFGGDECESPTVEISKQRKPRLPLVPPPVAAPRLSEGGERPKVQPDGESFVPGPLRRAQTGYSGVSEAPEPEIPLIPAGKSVPAKFLESPVVSHDDKRRSFIEMHQAEMREAEGLAFAKAVRTGTDLSRQTSSGTQASTVAGAAETPTDDGIVDSPASAREFYAASHQLPAGQPPHPTSGQSPRDGPPPIPPPRRRPVPPEQLIHADQQAHENHRPATPDRLKKPVALDQSPSSIHSTASSFNHPYAALRQGSRISEKDANQLPSPRRALSTLHDVTLAAADDALQAFVARTRHLFELFRLHSESVRPLVACSPHELARAALWWFLTGRLALENAIRDRPTGPEYQQQHERAKQQAYSDLAKGYWLSEEIIPELASGNRITPDSEVEEVRASLMTNLRKLAISMKRNDLLPPEEPFLPQIIDRSIWLEYPQVNQDLVSLLWGSSSSSLIDPKPTGSGMSLLEGLPLSDSPVAFCFGRFRADLFLMERGREKQQLFFPCYLSIVRPQTQPDILFVIASQNGAVQLRISGSRSFGPTWEDVVWRSENCSLEVKLPRGFFLAIQCPQQQYKMIWSMYDFSAKVHASLYPRPDEKCIFRSTLRAFQYFDNDPQSRQFPKESMPGCEVGLFERIFKEGAAAGPRFFHRGYRIAVVTGTTTKTLSGINQAFIPQMPVQYGFLRSDANDPALSLKFENGRQKGNMVLSFNDEQERLRLHNLLIGTALGRDEEVFCEVPLQGVWFSERYGDPSQPCLKVISNLTWQKARVINHDNDGERPSCVLADKLRVVYEFKEGTVTDRINVAPGELRLRLDVRNPSCMMVYRQSQNDMTIAIMEAMVQRELPPDLCEALDMLRRSPSIRTFMFPSAAELHAFEEAVTGYKVLYDGIASTFAIARRRMVVPIHKKWEAGETRIQVVQRDGVIQLLAFFDDFSHGKCMGFSLKGTDVFESFGKGSKAGLKIVDAKFPLPKPFAPDVDDAQAAAEACFVCLDLPELPGEHDDISILFESEAERDKFISFLPASVKGARMSSLKIKGLS